ncbi:hypothetical protein JOF28_001398 [Leucobacter exalbidus]|uniref:YokE-like PH domain-containing protein n=1 Tax=Leucobacter exalbidus TaxID=662960 RepID=A0A940PVX6_9MICO|nr:PH domain-containing protein [Leucobacter exalbidus]MBP1326166.1 hypothetical protein [Leucobacter exalbidus]
MTTTRAAMTYATALNRNELYESPGLRRDIPKVLHPEEEVLLALPGVAGDFPFVMIVTDSRFILARVAGIFKGSKISRQVPLAEVVGVRYRPWLFAMMKVDTASRRAFRMMPQNNADAERFARDLEHLIQFGSLPA